MNKHKPSRNKYLINIHQKATDNPTVDRAGFSQRKRTTESLTNVDRTRRSVPSGPSSRCDRCDHPLLPVCPAADSAVSMRGFRPAAAP